ncbi:MAG: hypothetical protein LBU42_03435 [Prevotellaceae bacterium]|jgi:DUF4097 and DUF4098 domain-containing protein YvlB|nr:hypothetical protein [Prevotellaceae bacterium]
MKKTMFLAALLMSFAATAPLFADNDEKESNEPFAVYKFPVAAIEKVTVSTAGGSIRVAGDATGEAVVSVWIRSTRGKKLPKEDIQKILDEHYDLAVKAEHGELRAEARRVSDERWSSTNSLSVSFRLSVPQKIASRLETSGGSIYIRNLTGKEDVTTSGGSVYVEEVSGTVTGRTSGGSIRLSASKGDIQLSTSGGSIRAQDSEGDITLSTSGGSVRLDHINGNIRATTSGGTIRLADLTGTIQARTSGGSIHADRVSGTLTAGTSGGSMKLAEIAGNLDARTSGGGMNVQMTSVSEYVRLTNSGHITLSLPGGKGYALRITGQHIDTGVLENFSGVFESKTIDGTLNGGGAEINIRSSQRVRLMFE